MKKVQIISKDGSKTEVYFLSDHPTNKFVPPVGAEVLVEEFPVAADSPLPLLAPDPSGGFMGANPIYVDEDHEKGYKEMLNIISQKGFDPLDVPLKAGTPNSYKKLASLFLGSHAPDMFAIDDSLESDAIGAGDLVKGNLYRIKGLNVVAKFTSSDEVKSGMDSRMTVVAKFSFHGHLFWVEPNMILKHRLDK